MPPASGDVLTGARQLHGGGLLVPAQRLIRLHGVHGRRPLPRHGGGPPGVVLGSGRVQQQGGAETDLDAWQKVTFTASWPGGAAAIGW
ncbi:hypothetical protein [Streptomyces achromogenes]|uniref:hypothetical protein n=1 Tax=Streptomyces achromogenes TaxID=67255 RepID=UPI0033D3E1FC